MGFHSKAAAVPTVTEVIDYENVYGGQGEWFTAGTYSIPASVKKIAAVNLSPNHKTTTSTCWIRAVYNGVEKYYRTESVPQNQLLKESATFNGLGIVATLNLDHKTEADAPGKCSGNAWTMG